LRLSHGACTHGVGGAGWIHRGSCAWQAAKAQPTQLHCQRTCWDVQVQMLSQKWNSFLKNLAIVVANRVTSGCGPVRAPSGGAAGDTAVYGAKKC
jgi:hypothetical protein